MTEVVAGQTGPDPATSAPTVEERLEAKFFNEEPQTPEQTGEEQPEGQTEATTEAPEDSEEFEFEDLKFSLPKEQAQKLKSAVEGYKDYTRKTQTVAERERLVAAQEALMRSEREYEASVADELRQLHQYNAAIDSYKHVEWNSLDMETMVKTRNNLDVLRDSKVDLERKLQNKRGEFDTKRQEQYNSLRAAAEAQVKLAIPGWGQEKAKVLSDYGMGEGYTAQELSTITDPRAIKMLWKASQWDKLQSEKGLSVKRAQGAPAVIKPGASNPQVNAHMEKMRFRKEVQNTQSAQGKAALIQKRLERLV